MNLFLKIDTSILKTKAKKPDQTPSAELAKIKELEREVRRLGIDKVDNSVCFSLLTLCLVLSPRYM